MTHALNALAKNGVLRAAINTGNRALVQQDGERLTGKSPALAQRLAETIGARLQPVMYTGAGNVFEDAEADVWDVAFLAIDTLRAKRVSFTRPYHVIEATYAVRADGPVQSVEDADSDGVRILTSVGSAYDMYLSDTLKHASHTRIGTPPDSFEAFKSGDYDLVAGIRQSLDRAFGEDPAYRVLPGVLTKVEQAMVLPGAAALLIGALDAFVAEAIADGTVDRA